MKAYGSLSAREVAFEKLIAEHPEIRTNARLWWATLLILELLPVLLKLMSRNNPAAAEAQADLAEDAIRHRLRLTRLEALESRFPFVIARDDVQDSLDTVAAEYTRAMNHLSGFRQLIDRLAQEIGRQRHFSRANPDFAQQADAAFAAAVSDAFESVSRPTPFRMAAE